METLCKECKYFSDAIDKIPYCNLHKCQIAQSGCECGKHKSITNADRIRAMTDEELACLIADQRFVAINPVADKLRIDITTQYLSCKNHLLDWLKQEVDDG